LNNIKSSGSLCFNRKANQNDLNGAIEDFRRALDVNPKHRNGRKYLIETSLSIARRFVGFLSCYNCSKFDKF